MPLPTLTFPLAFISPPTLIGVPTPSFPQTKQTSAQPMKLANSCNEKSSSIRVQGGGVGEDFAQTKQNQESNLSNTVSKPSCCMESMLCLDLPNTAI